MRIEGFGIAKVGRILQRLKNHRWSGANRTIPADNAQARLRLAIISTPRSGNTWLRHILSAGFALQEIDRHRPDEVPWDDLPERCVLQIHWLREPRFIDLIERCEFRPVVLARHPLDMLISLLHWVDCCPHTRSVWTDNPALGGARGNEVPLLGASPTNEVFLAWACSPRAEALLSVSLQWWDAPGAIHVRYEDLVQSAAHELLRIGETLQVDLIRSASEVAAENSMERLRQRRSEPEQHYWQGQPGAWRRLLPAAEARRIASAHPNSFSRFRYCCNPDESLTRDQAEMMWQELIGG